MDQIDKTRRIFLIGTIILGVLIVGGLVWAVAMGPAGSAGNIDPNIVFNDDNDPTQGLADAKVTVRIYSDFQCPACKVAEGVMRQVMNDYDDRVRFVWNDFPLSQLHSDAQPAAIAARCAQDQAKFWEYAAKLYDTQGDWEKLASPLQYFIDLAGQLGLQQGDFTACLGQDASHLKVAQDLQEADSMGLDATPTFFVNRTKYAGAMDSDKWHEILDAAIKAN
jgi:protein-disulfide isomerase